MKRPVIVQKIKQLPILPSPRNVIIEYEKPKAVAIRHVIEEGVVRADPATYQITPAHGEIRYVDRITDLPIENSNILSQLNYEASTSTDNSSYAKYLSATSSHFSKKDGNSRNNDDTYDHYDVISSSNNDGQEYETITTSVSESLAAKIIAEAKAAGAICSSSAFNNLKNN
jgi:hypothetical protein